MSPKTVLIAGVSGLVGSAAARAFAAAGWRVIGISRRLPPVEGVEHLALDLLDEAACRAERRRFAEATHLVFAALEEQPGLSPGWTDPALMERNARMLRNLFEPFAETAPLEHVSLLQGTKAYGVHHPAVDRGAIRVPLREREPRVDHPNFYWLQEDYLRRKQRDGTWGLTIFRPTVIYGDAAGVNMNPMLPIAVWATLQREAGEPLHFPGRGSGLAIQEAVDADLLARALVWAAESPAARDRTFNVTNGDVFQWRRVWPAIAEEFGLPPGEHRPVSLAEELPRRSREWASAVDRYGLAAPRDPVEFCGANSVVYADMLLAMRESTPPLLNSTIALRQAGFHECMDTEDMFRALIRRLRAKRLIP